MTVVPKVQHTNDKGKTALLISAERGNAKMVQILLDNKVDVDALDGYGRTALHLAVARGHVDVVARLLRCGADTDVVDLGDLEWCI